MTKTKRPLVLEIEKAVMALANPVRGVFLQGFFKTGKGQYGEGDVFLGLSVPQVRKTAKMYQKGVQLPDIDQLLENEAHEIRLIALIFLVNTYAKSNPSEKKEIFEFYLNHTHRINNWDLVDLSAYQIVGDHILHHAQDRARVTKLQASPNLWERRITIVAMFAFVKSGEFELPLLHLRTLVNDKHDLIQKAVGWVLRSLGDKDRNLLTDFLNEHAGTMPRTALRYAIEHLNPTDRQKYLQLKKMKEQTC